MSRADRLPLRAGVGLRLPHLVEVAATRPSAAWLEIHPENVLANPYATEVLVGLSREYPMALHTVGLSIGSANGIDRRHLGRIRTLVDAVDPILISGHLAWSTHAGEYLNDLLPLPYDRETLDLVSRQLDEVQNALGRPYLVENPSNYVGFRDSAMTELEFLGELVERTGCQLLCDVSNVHLSAHNMGYDARAYIDGFPAGAVAELHLGGFEAEADDATPGHQVLIDTHGRPVAEPSWELYARALRRFGPTPTLIEWDNDLPAFTTLLEEAGRADGIAASVFSPGYADAAR